MPAGEVWRHLMEEAMAEGNEWGPALRVLVEQGPLAGRIQRALPAPIARASLRDLYAGLSFRLQGGAVLGSA